MVVPRIPYTLPFPPPTIYPPHAVTLPAAIAAVTDFLHSRNTVLLTGAGISIESGLADYRGEKGTYRLNNKYRPIFFGEFAGSHESRKRYWARSFFGWPTMENARPNRTHMAISKLGELGVVSHVVTQNVDSFHHVCHPKLPTTELHGTLRTVTCLTCHSEYPRVSFQKTLARLNPKWADFLQTAIEAGAFSKNNREESIKTNPDGDVDLPGAPYTKFRYPPCPKCLEETPDGTVLADNDGAHIPKPDDGSMKGILKPNVTFFGESISEIAKKEASRVVEEADNLLVLGTSLATYSAWRIAKAAHVKGMGVGIINLGGVRGEDLFFSSDARGERIRIELASGDVLGGVVKELLGAGGIGLGG
ncbi:DHS-like NAD/FAD-binding domain-containing protein [Morchella snyderi]|nr:DHS-like NAD/FAD-binding domain-containing protein [Morchella snyderi]